MEPQRIAHYAREGGPSSWDAPGFLASQISTGSTFDCNSGVVGMDSGRIRIPVLNDGYAHIGASLAKLVASAGSEQFGHELLMYLHDLCGADNFSIFSLSKDALHLVKTAHLHDNDSALTDHVSHYASKQQWRTDPMMLYVNTLRQTGAHVFRKRARDLTSHELQAIMSPSILDRVLISGPAGESTLCLSILKSDRFGTFSDAEMGRIQANSELLYELVVKDFFARSPMPNPASALQSLDDIENCLTEMTELPRREMEVCARMLLCQTALGISLSLGISEESVKTYRVRAYKRLEISGVRELWVWYLNLWYMLQLRLQNSGSSRFSAATSVY